MSPLVFSRVTQNTPTTKALAQQIELKLHRHLLREKDTFYQSHTQDGRTIATLKSLVQGIQTALTTGGSPPFATSSCFYALDPRKSLSFPPTDQFAVLQPTALRVKQRAFGQGQPTNATLPMIVSFEITLWLYVRLALDEYNRSDSYLLDANYGALVLADSVIDTLQAYVLQDGINLWGYELDSIEWATEERDSVGWSVTRLKYHTDLTAR